MMPAHPSPNPFQEARLKLTGWYFLSFSILILLFTGLTLQAKESSFIRVHTTVNSTVSEPQALEQFQQSYDEFNRRFKERLLMFDLVVLVIGVFLSYWLSGKTLQPIQVMLKDQEAFAADISHELRTPLTIMQAEMEAYERTGGSKNPRQVINSLRDEVMRMTHLIDGLLLLVRQNSLQLRKSFSPVALDELVEKAVTSLSPIAKHKRISFEVRIDESPMIQGNPHQLLQVLLILMDNAVKYSDSGKTVQISVEADKSAGMITITDEGYGISAEDLEQIFSRYYRATKGKAMRQKGTGLGLYIALKIIDLHHGSIRVKSKLNQGSTFSLRFPNS
jgi:signal transduction histidine kinase